MGSSAMGASVGLPPQAAKTITRVTNKLSSINNLVLFMSTPPILCFENILQLCGSNYFLGFSE